VANAQASDFAPLRGFAAGLLKDYDAVRAGLTLHWSSGAVEGNVTLKSIKRQMYGRPTSISVAASCWQHNQSKFTESLPEPLSMVMDDRRPIQVLCALMSVSLDPVPSLDLMIVTSAVASSPRSSARGARLIRTSVA
jgi:hypothetical protein